jgi:hypothetical protein
MFPEVAIIQVEEPFKGSSKGEYFVLSQPGNDCAPKFKQGEHVLLYINPSSVPQVWVAFGCGRTRSLDFAKDDLMFLRALPNSADKSRFAGEVALYENSVSDGFRRSRVLPGVHVFFRSGNYSAEAVTNEDGVYEIYACPQGRYRVSMDIPKGLRIYFPMVGGGERRRNSIKDLLSPEPTIDMGKRTAADIDFVLVVDNQISGRVFDSAGKPVKDVCVQLTPIAEKASSYFNVFGCSKDDGSYLLKDMPPGQYLITAEPWANGRPQLPKVFYPGTTEPAVAGVVTIGVGEHLGGFNIRMTRQVNAERHFY